MVEDIKKMNHHDTTPDAGVMFALTLLTTIIITICAMVQ